MKENDEFKQFNCDFQINSSLIETEPNTESEISIFLKEHGKTEEQLDKALDKRPCIEDALRELGISYKEYINWQKSLEGDQSTQTQGAVVGLIDRAVHLTNAIDDEKKYSKLGGFIHRQEELGAPARYLDSLDRRHSEIGKIAIDEFKLAWGPIGDMVAAGFDEPEIIAEIEKDRSDYGDFVKSNSYQLKKFRGIIKKTAGLE